MIVNIRGTCGSGKSTVVHNYMNGQQKVPVWSFARKRPVGYLLTGNVFVAGHYEIPMGGIDTFKTLEEAFITIKRFALEGRKVLFEGKVQNRDVPWLLDLSKRWPLTVVHLTTSPDEAVLGVRKRPSATDIREELIRRVHRKCERDLDVLDKAGIPIVCTTRNNALRAVKEALNGNAAVRAK